jgi:hypothetical protein
MQKKKKQLSKFHTLLICSIFNQNLLKKNVEQNIGVVFCRTKYLCVLIAERCLSLIQILSCNSKKLIKKNI